MTKKLKLLIGSIFLIVSIIGFNVIAAPGNDEALWVIEKDIADILVRADGSDTQTNEIQTLVRSQLAVDSLSQVDIPYLENTQSVQIIAAYTITPDGKKIAVGKEAIKTTSGDTSEGKAQFSDQKHLIIIFPNVAPGSRTYYKAVTNTRKPLFPGQYFARYWFGPSTHWGHSEINLTHDPKIVLQVEATGLEGGRVASAPNGDIRYRYSYHSDGIQLSEPNQISDSDRSPHFYASSFKDQIDMGRAYELRAKDKYQVTPAVQQLADQITAGIDDRKEQAQALYFWVSKEIRYVAIYLTAGGVVPHSADEVLAGKYGDCKGKVTLYSALLAAKHIDSSAALINSGSSYELPNLAVLGPFNHVIAYLPDWDMYVDPTAERAPFGVLPLSEMDKPTVLTKLGKIGRTPKANANNNTVTTYVQLNIDSDGHIHGSSHTTYTGIEDIGARYTYEGSDSTYGPLVVRDNLQRARLTGVGQYFPSNATDLKTPFYLDTTFSVDPVTNFPGPGAITAPMGLAPAELVTLAYNKPPEKVSKPVVCRSRALTEKLILNFPSDVKVTRIPKGVSYSNDGINFLSTYSQNGNQVEINRSMNVQHPSMICEIEDVEDWKRFISVLQKDLRSQIFYE